MESDELKRAKDLLYCVLMFHSGGPWSKEKQEVWNTLLGNGEGTVPVTTKALCDKIRGFLGFPEPGEAE